MTTFILLLFFASAPDKAMAAHDHSGNLLRFSTEAQCMNAKAEQEAAIKKQTTDGFELKCVPFSVIK